MSEIERIKAGLATSFARMDAALKAMQEEAPPLPSPPGAHEGDPTFRLVVEATLDPERPCIIEIHEAAPVPRLVGFVELRRGAVIRMIVEAADTIGAGVILTMRERSQ